MAGIGVGPVFLDVSFISNSAHVEGAVSMLGSGKTKGFDDVESPDPTTFSRCRFVDNRASTTGSAVETAAGEEVFTGCAFRGNAARVGGAMRLAGTGTVSSSSFVETFRTMERGQRCPTSDRSRAWRTTASAATFSTAKRAVLGLQRKLC